MLKFFNLSPDKVDKMEKERVYKLLWLEEKWKEKENSEQTKAMKK